IPKPEGARQVEYPRTAIREGRRDFRRERFWQREKDRICLSRKLFDVEGLNWRIPDSRERGDTLRFRAPRGHRKLHVHIGMSRKAPQQLEAGIPRCAGDTYSNWRIVIHRNA